MPEILRGKKSLRVRLMCLVGFFQRKERVKQTEGKERENLYKFRKERNRCRVCGFLPLKHVATHVYFLSLCNVMNLFFPSRSSEKGYKERN